LKPCRLQVEQSAETAKPANDAGTASGVSSRLDGVYQRVTGSDIDPGGAIRVV